jgi:hypothetical protein
MKPEAPIAGPLRRAAGRRRFDRCPDNETAEEPCDVERSGAMTLGRVLHARWLAVAMTVAAACLGACGDDGVGAKGATATTNEHSSDRSAGSEKIVIKVHAELQDVVDKGEVLSGSSLGNAPFCRGGRFTGAHGKSAMIDRTFRCHDGTLRIGFTPGKERGRRVSGRWKVLSGTGAFKGMKGSGRMQTRFAPGSQPAEAREAFTGSVAR